jgi:hypothetical protein
MVFLARIVSMLRTTGISGSFSGEPSVVWQHRATPVIPNTGQPTARSEARIDFYMIVIRRKALTQ